MTTQPSQERLTELAEKLANGTITAAERKEFEQWYQAFDDHQLEKESQESVEDLEARLHLQIMQRGHITARPPRKLVYLSRVAAAAIILISLSFVGYWLTHQPEAAQQAVAENDIAPGRHTATLTLANGRRIVLANTANGQIATEAGTAITKTSDGQLLYTQADSGQPESYNTLSTASAETYQLRLPDGTRVWLNANSSLKFPTSFTGAERLVELTGEAYFSVVHHAAQPFRVKYANQMVEDIGTEFNINSYSDEAASQVTLVEGAASVQAAAFKVVLQPGQQATLGEAGFQLKTVNTEAIAAWKNERFYFADQDFKAAMRQLARWYDVKVVFDENLPANINAGGWLPRNTPLSVVLKSLEDSGIARFRLDKRTLYVRK